jgi:hypothetical protein
MASHMRTHFIREECECLQHVLGVMCPLHFAQSSILAQPSPMDSPDQCEQ